MKVLGMYCIYDIYGIYSMPSKIMACKDICWGKYTCLVDGQSKSKAGAGLEPLESSRSS